MAIKNDKDKIEARNLSFDHKPHHNSETIRIRKAGGYVSIQGRMNDNLNVCRGFGDFAYKTNPKLGVH